jgi:hypothetical protein
MKLRKKETIWHPFNNFIIGFIFSLIYVLLIIVVAQEIEVIDNIYFDFIILPVIIFMPLIYVDRLLFFQKC